ncbi:hypothetical protein CKO08_11685 [Halorhodospira halochloris]|nr:hypothetical protein [Halorhodospira halochloris]
MAMYMVKVPYLYGIFLKFSSQRLSRPQLEGMETRRRHADAPTGGLDDDPIARGPWIGRPINT